VGVLIRSKLFVPGSRVELFDKALASAADSVSIDLEDAVPADRKTEAATAVSAFLRTVRQAPLGKTMIVRVNGLATPHFESDLCAVVWPTLDILNLPKVESADDVRLAAAALARLEHERGIERPIGILANIETPAALRRAADIAAADPRVVGLQLGFADLLEPLGIDRADVFAVRQIQLAVRLAAGEAGVWAYDAAFADVKNRAGFIEEAQAAQRLGYMGKSCIHPSQIELANSVFQPNEKKIADAVRVLEASRDAEQSGLGAFMVNGRMVDVPFIRQAEAVVGLAERLGLLPSK
jgi:citrate lyase subunit beta/citryl-CoA lyase